MAKKTTQAGRVRYALWLDLDVLDRLREYQAELGVPVSESIRRAIRTFVDTLKPAKVKKAKPAVAECRQILEPPSDPVPF